jgi:hypothetical protein
MHISGRFEAQELSPTPVVVGPAEARAPARKVIRSIMARSERFELPTLGFEVRCSIQLSYERMGVSKVQPGILTFRHRTRAENTCAPDYQSCTDRATPPDGDQKPLEERPARRGLRPTAQ